MSKALTIDEINDKLKNNTTLELINITGNHRNSIATVHCKKCGAVYTLSRGILQLYRGCSVCDSKRIIVGINDIATTDSWMIKYFKNKEDSHTYMRTSNVKVDLICPHCKKETKMLLSNLGRRGFVCQYCNDGISYPNKFIRNLLYEMNVENLQFEYSPDWIKPRRFDAYFELNGNKYIVEMDGGFHFKDSVFKRKRKTKEEIQQIDKEKQQKAEEHGIEVIRINCDDDRIIENEITKSKLNELFNLNDFDFTECKIKSSTSELLSVCNDWNDGLSVLELSAKYKYSKNTILKWLRNGVVLGLCNYSKKESLKRGRKIAWTTRRQQQSLQKESNINECK